MSIVLFVSVTVLLVLGVPVAFAMMLAAVLAVLADGRFPLLVVLKEMFTGIDSFPLMAVPFFILAAELMTGGSLTAVLLRFANQFVGHRRGGLGHANVLALTLFSGISGSALADAAGPGAMMIRMMGEAGYSRAYAAALTAATSIVGPIIPPSIIMIVYALQDPRVSVAALFMAGIIPGLLIAIAMAVVNHVVSARRGYRGRDEQLSMRDQWLNAWRALPALLLPVVILGGIRGGIFTPTEASVVAVFYALLCGSLVYRSLELRSLPAIFVRASLLTATVLILVAASAAFSWVLTIETIPQQLATWIAGLNLPPLALLVAINLFLLAFGIFIEPLPGVMVLAPILAPVAAAAGIDPIHFAMVVIVNLTLGMITPPVGGLLFVTSVVARVPVSALTRELAPFMLAHLVVLALLIAIPPLSTWLPRLSGYAS